MNLVRNSGTFWAGMQKTLDAFWREAIADHARVDAMLDVLLADAERRPHSSHSLITRSTGMAAKKPAAVRGKIDTHAAAKILKLSFEHVGKLCRHGKLKGAVRKAVKSGDNHTRLTWLIPAASVRAYAKSRQ